MKRYLIALMAMGVITVACNSQPKSSDLAENKAEEKVVDGGKTVQLNKAMFIDEIMDYESNPTEWLYKGTKPGIIDFYADWCRPCRMTSPILEELAQEYAGKVTIYKVNVDKERELAGIFGVQSIPTFLYMPMSGKPTISSGIAQTPEATKQMFVEQIEMLLE